jgi:hypothetical protein
MQPKIFGIGYNKTGTSTLGSCLRVLGYRHMTYDYDLMRYFFEENHDPIYRVIDAHDSFEDWPFPLMYRDLADRYPDARFILTIRRSSNAWFESLRRHARRSNIRKHERNWIYGIRYPENGRARYIEKYEAHNASVRHDLGDRVHTICWENGDGWPELCGFLGVEAPDLPLPHENRGDNRASPMRRLTHEVLSRLEAARAI